MRLLLDTCTFLWLAVDSPKLSKDARAALRDGSNPAYLSPASAWEIGLKHYAGSLELPEPPGRWVPRIRALHELETLPIDEASALAAARLPNLHRDPFDRLLIAQAIQQGLILVTPDELITQYPIRTLW